MTKLFVAFFDDTRRAHEILEELQDMEFEQLIDLKDAVVVTKNQRGKMRIYQTHDVTPGLGALSGAAVGVIVGGILGGPLGWGLLASGAAVGLLAGSGVGALVAALIDTGVDNHFIRQVAEALQPNTSAIFVLARKGDEEMIRHELARFATRMIETEIDSQHVEAIQATVDNLPSTPSKPQ
ncbi:MAG: hypothetical protein CUN49_05495 [Candidatus Thermofonsia Clade 1 bacterium]|jgi:uncharacterized membrane protein|uniref:DUF1269 domain-containing protein n=1 Tax=Candidatus Thermofonsia Clade 1 bacterium TaxID=2364210 RepID=A0A2M8PFW5_9CHLR|nr:MAG: hypothetical protein CUN49_05495 [Candidatus Thermofonsia Clade 1 bacterium]RMF49353.1 MAG: DUF1269 domain-containing protein [Chloroflexota bacterium]